MNKAVLFVDKHEIQAGISVKIQGQQRISACFHSGDPLVDAPKQQGEGRNPYDMQRAGIKNEPLSPTHSNGYTLQGYDQNRQKGAVPCLVRTDQAHKKRHGRGKESHKPSDRIQMGRKPPNTYNGERAPNPPRKDQTFFHGSKLRAGTFAS